MANIHPISPLGPVKLAVTIDDMLLFRGSPMPPGYDLMRTARAFTSALNSHKARDIFAFSNTSPVETVGRDVLKVFDYWLEQGHHVANHTHHHGSLNWMSADAYVGDIERAADIIEPWIARAPKRYFRFCLDTWGDTPEKQDAVQTYLSSAGYIPVPISVGFPDIQFLAPYWRTLKAGDKESAAWLRKVFVETAVYELRKHAANARAVFGRDPVHIWLVHGTPIAGDCLAEILDRFAEANVEFVSLEEAMADPMNCVIPPRISLEFLRQVEKWALALGVPVDDRPPRVIEEIEKLHPAPGESGMDIFHRMVAVMPERLGAVVAPFPLADCQR